MVHQGVSQVKRPKATAYPARMPARCPTKLRVGGRAGERGEVSQQQAGGRRGRRSCCRGEWCYDAAAMTQLSVEPQHSAPHAFARASLPFPGQRGAECGLPGLGHQQRGEEQGGPGGRPHGQVGQAKQGQHGDAACAAARHAEVDSRGGGWSTQVPRAQAPERRPAQHTASPLSLQLERFQVRTPSFSAPAPRPGNRAGRACSVERLAAAAVTARSPGCLVASSVIQPKSTHE